MTHKKFISNLCRIFIWLYSGSRSNERRKRMDNFGRSEFRHIGDIVPLIEPEFSEKTSVQKAVALLKEALEILKNLEKEQ